MTQPTEAIQKKAIQNGSFEIDPKMEIGLTTLAVKELDALVNYYQTMIGLQLLDRGGDRAYLGIDNHPFLELVARPAGQRHPHAAGLYHLAILLPSRADLGHWLNHYVRTTGGMVPGAGDHIVSEALYLSDPEGNGVELYRDLPRSEWTYDNEGYFKMGTLAVDLPRMLQAAPDQPFNGLPSGTKVGHIHLQVEEIPATKRFYGELLGIKQTVPDSLASVGFFGAGGYHHHIGSNIWHSNGNRVAPEGSLGLQRFELNLSSKTALDQLLDRLDNQNVPFQTEEGKAVLIDPSGNTVVLTSGQ